MGSDHGEVVARGMGTERIIMALAFTAMSVISVAGNFHIIYSISSVRKLQTVANSFLFSLAIADFIVGAVVIPTSIITAIANRWLAGDVVCDLSAFVDNVTLTMSMWSLGLLSIERFFLMVFPFRYHTFISTKSATWLIWVSWFVVAVICLCPMLGWGEYGYTETYSCGLLPVESTPGYYYFPFFCIAAFLPPIAVGTCSYMAILCVLHEQRTPKIYSAGTGNERVKRTEVEKQENLTACLSVFICLLMMILFNLPTVVIGLCAWSKLDLSEIPAELMLFFHIVWYAKSAANPLVFGLLNKNFRNEIKKYRLFRICFGKDAAIENENTFRSSVNSRLHRAGQN